METLIMILDVFAISAIALLPCLGPMSVAVGVALFTASLFCTWLKHRAN